MPIDGWWGVMGVRGRALALVLGALTVIVSGLVLAPNGQAAPVGTAAGGFRGAVGSGVPGLFPPRRGRPPPAAPAARPAPPTPPPPPPGGSCSVKPSPPGGAPRGYGENGDGPANGVPPPLGWIPI